MTTAERNTVTDIKII